MHKPFRAALRIHVADGTNSIKVRGEAALGLRSISAHSLKKVGILRAVQCSHQAMVSVNNCIGARGPLDLQVKLDKLHDLISQCLRDPPLAHEG